MSTLGSLINVYANAEAVAGNWSAVAAKLNAATVAKTSAGTLTSMAKTLAALAANEREPTLQAFASTNVGQDGRTKLATVGLDFAHPITVGLIQELSPILPNGAAAKLLALGNWTVSPAANAGLPAVTAEQCQNAWTEFSAEQSALQTEAKRKACRTAIQNLDVYALIPDVGSVPTLDNVVAAIRANLESFGAWG